MGGVSLLNSKIMDACRRHLLNIDLWIWI